MRMKRTWSGRATPLLLTAVLLLAGCVGNRKIVLLQDQNANIPWEALVDKSWSGKAPSFKIRPGDVFMVTVDHSNLIRDVVPQTTTQSMDLYRSIQHPYVIGYTVDSTGTITLPEIGKVQVAGMGIGQAEKAVLAQASSIYSDASVKLVMLNFTITVLGEVNRPGKYPVYNNSANILEGLAMANDMTVLADRTRIRVIRNREGSNHLYHVDLLDQELLGDPRFYLQPNDVIVVDPLRRRVFSGRDPNLVLGALTLMLSVISLYATLHK